MAALLQEMSVQAARLLPALDQVDAQAWVAKGASETYLAQLQSSKEQARALSDGAKAVARNPEKLASLLVLFLRIEALDTMLRSLEEGIRKYQTPSVAENIAALAAAGGANRERFRSYMVNLAAEREQQFEIMDREAQRCRTLLTQPRRNSGRKQ
jgi:F0F1-type ATP synthase membrane subunit c/vacuolar-type H+-ATPase subunit K